MDWGGTRGGVGHGPVDMTLWTWVCQLLVPLPSGGSESGGEGSGGRLRLS